MAILIHNLIHTFISCSHGRQCHFAYEKKVEKRWNARGRENLQEKQRKKKQQQQTLVYRVNILLYMSDKHWIPF